MMGKVFRCPSPEAPGEDSLSSGAMPGKRKSAPIWPLQADAFLAHGRQKNMLALEVSGCWEVKCGQSSPSGVSGVL